MNRLIRLNALDNVAVALAPVLKGETLTVDGLSVTALCDVPMGHKLALFPIEEGARVVKYGCPIGAATRFIPAGDHVHTHNVRTLLNEKAAYSYHQGEQTPAPRIAASFMGYERADKKGAGVRNDLWIVPTVGCVNGVARALSERVAGEAKKAGVRAVALCHPYGCSQMAQDQENTRNVLARLATHPNAGGVLVLGLGCENSGVEEIRKRMGNFDESRVRFLVCQDVEDELSEGERLLLELLDRVKGEKRVEIDASRLIVGLKCGGSDGLSGVTANPVIGAFSDMLVAAGGTAILTEVPEMFGAERLLMNRCATGELFRKTVALINDFKAYYENSGLPVYENPSPGNKAGGITTLEDKALGCTQKSGFSPVCGVLSYGETVENPGLNLLSAPGNDLVATTALAASGAQLVLFSTGRGTPFMGPVPTIKISSNAPLANKKRGWIDFDASAAAQGTPIQELGKALFSYALEVAGGRETLSEQNGYHDIAIFKTGVTL